MLDPSWAGALIHATVAIDITPDSSAYEHKFAPISPQVVVWLAIFNYEISSFLN
jgi:hypothetical protein